VVVSTDVVGAVLGAVPIGDESSVVEVGDVEVADVDAGTDGVDVAAAIEAVSVIAAKDTSGRSDTRLRTDPTAALAKAILSPVAPIQAITRMNHQLRQGVLRCRMNTET